MNAEKRGQPRHVYLGTDHIFRAYALPPLTRSDGTWYAVLGFVMVMAPEDTDADHVADHFATKFT
jgi:hypothetical protein